MRVEGQIFATPAADEPSTVRGIVHTTRHNVVCVRLYNGEEWTVAADLLTHVPTTPETP